MQSALNLKTLFLKFIKSSSVQRGDLFARRMYPKSSTQLVKSCASLEFCSLPDILTGIAPMNEESWSSDSKSESSSIPMRPCSEIFQVVNEPWSPFKISIRSPYSVASCFASLRNLLKKLNTSTVIYFYFLHCTSEVLLRKKFFPSPSTFQWDPLNEFYWFRVKTRLGSRSNIVYTLMHGRTQKMKTNLNEAKRHASVTFWCCLRLQWYFQFCSCRWKHLS